MTEETTGDDSDEIDDARTHGYLGLEHRTHKTSQRNVFTVLIIPKDFDVAVAPGSIL